MGVKIQPNNKGFTLVEVICAVTIMMLVVVPIFTGFLMAAKTNASYGDKLEINMMLENELEAIKATGMLEGYSEDGAVMVIKLNSTGMTKEIGDVVDKFVPQGPIELLSKPVKATVVPVNYNESIIAYYKITLTYDDPSITGDEVTLEGGVYAPW